MTRNYSVGILVLLSIVMPGLAQVKERPKKERDGPGLEGLKALRNEDPDVRWKAAAVLVRLGPVAKFASKDLREAFREETDLDVKVKMAEAIWAVDRPISSVLTPFLIEALAVKDPEIRIGAAGVLGQMGVRAKVGVPHLISRLKDEAISVRIAAVLALGEIGPTAQKAAEPILAMIHEKEDPLVDSMAAIALGMMGPEVAPLLTKALEDPLQRKRMAAAFALGDLGPVAKDAVPGLVKLLNDKETLGPAIVLRALGKIGAEAKAAAPAIEPFLLAKNPDTRLEAALCVYLVQGDAKHLPIVAKYLTDEKAGVQYEACLVLKRFGVKAKETAPTLRELLKHRDFKIRMAAAVALWSATEKAEESLKVYRATIDNSDNAIRGRTLEYLTEMGPAAAPLLPLIREAARDDNDWVRNLARGLLTKLQDAK